MQLMIDITVETPEALDLAAHFLTQHAALKRAGSLPAYAGQPFGGPVDVPAGTPAAPIPPAPIIPPPPPLSNVVPFPVPAPPSASVGESSAIPPAPPAALTPTAPSAPAPTTTVAPPTVSPAASSASSTDEYDSSGFPFDARIHQKSKGKKKDGTFKLQKGIDVALVTAVTTEIAASGRLRPPGTNTPTAGASSAPVSVPGTGAVLVPPAPTVVPSAAADTAGTGGAVPVPPPPAVGGVPVPPAPVLVPPAPSAAVPVPPAPNVGLPDAGNAAVVPPAPVVNDFRSFVAKITAARTAGKITAEQVTALIVQAGAPSLQLLNSMPHLIGTADAYLDAHLAMV